VKKEAPDQKQVQQIVRMKFSEAKYYTNLDVPCFEAGKVYEIVGADQVQRWLKRGGSIVEESVVPYNAINLNELVPPVDSISDEEILFGSSSSEEIEPGPDKKKVKKQKK